MSQNHVRERRFAQLLPSAEFHIPDVEIVPDREYESALRFRRRVIRARDSLHLLQLAQVEKYDFHTFVIAISQREYPDADLRTIKRSHGRHLPHSRGE